jgi:hypothetical protein
VIIYILLEFVATLTLKPRVYKRFKDTIVDAGSKMILVIFLVVSLYYDEQSVTRNGGQAVRADSAYCSNFLEGSSCESASAMCDWDTTLSQCVARPVLASVGALQHLLYGLPGLIALLLNKLCNSRRSAPKRSRGGS